MNNYKILKYCAAVFILIVVIATVIIHSVNGVRAASHDYFGGSISKVTYCTCYYDPGVVLEIKDKSRNDQTINVFYSFFFSKLYEDYNIWESNPNTAGGYTEGVGECLDTSGYYCKQNSDAEDVDGMIDYTRGIGSSLEGSSAGN